MSRRVQVGLSSLMSAAALGLVARVALGVPGAVALVTAGIGFVVFVLGYARSPLFARRTPSGPPCAACSGTGYRLVAHPFHMRRDPCPVCHGRGAAP